MSHFNRNISCNRKNFWIPPALLLFFFLLHSEYHFEVAIDFVYRFYSDIKSAMLWLYFEALPPSQAKPRYARTWSKIIGFVIRTPNTLFVHKFMKESECNIAKRNPHVQNHMLPVAVSMQHFQFFFVTLSVFTNTNLTHQLFSDIYPFQV